jgi:NAD(P)H-flavin reductase
MLKVIDGDVPERSQEGLASKLKQEKYFLACLCWPKTDIEIQLPDPSQICMRARVNKREDISDNLCRLFLQTEKPLSYRAGQFINIHKSESCVRSYSLASLPQQDQLLELHVKREGDGEMSNWILDELKEGKIFEIQGPSGECYYELDNPEQNILMVGTGTGLAPLLGIARDALLNGHKGSIHLYHGSRYAVGLYCLQELEALQAQYSNFEFHTCLSREGHDQHREGRASELALEDHPKLRGWAVYLCGDPDMVRDTQQKVNQAGARPDDVNIDPYEHS